MDPTRDNPIIRFNTFWWALWAFFAFAIVLAAVMIFNRNAPTNLEDAVAQARYKNLQVLKEAQTAALPVEAVEAVEAAIPEVAAKLAASKPAAVERPDQVVPDSPTSKMISAEPPLGPTAAPATTPTPAPPSAPSGAATPPIAVPPAPGGDVPKP
jgi:hypothetical protein